MRIVRLIGSIDTDTFSIFSEELATLEDKKSPVTVELTSEGGDGYVALAFYARIRRSPCEIRIVGLGPVISAATIILAAGDKRYMDQDAWFMVHDEQIDSSITNIQTAHAELEQAKVFEMHWAGILARHSNLSPKQWRELSEKTTYMSAEDCLKCGLIHAIY